LDTLFLTLPVSWRGTIAQYVGRLHRLYDGKREVRVYDYADLNVPMLARMFDRRCRGYEAVGYTIVLPASAIPGWPAGVTLPADPLWKRDYAASVRRLVRDGVDTPLANLFVTAARPIPPETEGANRARSASEAFLYRRLDSLIETRGRFQLNADLPIAFNGWGRMEIDLLCADSRVAIEIDGAQHLADPVAYRRDRRKDQLLQESGYLVLRYLAEDLGKETERSARRDSARNQFPAEIACGDEYSHPLAREPCKVMFTRSADRVRDAHPRGRARSRRRHRMCNRDGRQVSSGRRGERRELETEGRGFRRREAPR
jgi:very-short-patch-repair endonuclease